MTDRTGASVTVPDLAAEAEQYFAHDHRAVRIVLSGADPWPRFDPVSVLADPRGRPAVAALAQRLRAAGWANEPDGGPLSDLARGVPLERDDLDAALTPALVADLLACGALLPDGRAPRWNLGFGVMALADLLVAVPRDPEGPEQIYLGPESLWIERWCDGLGLRPERAVELGCGAGQLAAVVARRSRFLVASDLLPRATSLTALTWAMNPELAGRGAVVVGDVASGLRAGVHDLVVANPPWVPGDAAAPGAAVFKAGGTTGTELPIRFLREGLHLLAPGGTLLLLALDPVLVDGRRPLRAAAAGACAAGSGFVGGVVTTPFVERERARSPRRHAAFLARHPHLAAIDHVLIAIHRRPGPSTEELLPAEAWQRDLTRVRNDVWPAALVERLGST